MEVSVVFDDETEGELMVELCCEACAKTNYNVSGSQFKKVMELVNGGPIRLPSKVATSHHFFEWVKTSL